MTLFQQMAFVSSYEQDSGVLIKEKENLTSLTPEFPGLYRRLQGFHLSKVASKNQIHPPYLLLQIQVAIFLGMRDTDYNLWTEATHTNR